MFKVCIVAMLLLSSCSVMPRTQSKQKGIDPIFAPYVEDYRNIIGYNKYEHRFNKISINFVTDLSKRAIGRCWWLLDGNTEIEIDKEWWDSYWTSHLDKRMTVYHELEHCIRYRLHTNRVSKINSVESFLDEIGYWLGIIPKPGFLEDGCPSSIMNSYSASTTCQEKHYEYYIEEMRNL